MDLTNDQYSQLIQHFRQSSSFLFEEKSPDFAPAQCTLPHHGGSRRGAYATDNIKEKTAFGKGFGQSNLFYMRKLYLHFQISETVSHKLTWGHYFEILKSDSDLEIGFYANKTPLENALNKLLDV